MMSPKNKISMANQNSHSIPISDPETTITNPTKKLSANLIFQKVKNNLVLHSKWAELNGAMGDLGTYIPIVLSLTLSRNLNLGTTLIFTGKYSNLTKPLRNLHDLHVLQNCLYLLSNIFYVLQNYKTYYKISYL